MHTYGFMYEFVVCTYESCGKKNVLLCTFLHFFLIWLINLSLVHLLFECQKCCDYDFLPHSVSFQRTLFTVALVIFRRTEIPHEYSIQMNGQLAIFPQKFSQSLPPLY